MKFSTPVELPKSVVHISPRSHIMLIGSCFTEHIGRHISECLPSSQITVNPSGILYNPKSICNTIRHLLSPSFKFDEPMTFQSTDGLWHHWHYSTLFTAPNREELKERLRAAWESAHDVFNRIDLLLITFSTDHAYGLNEGPLKGTLVANCHKQPGRMFYETVLTLEFLREIWDSLLTDLQKTHPTLKVVFTLSPYRYAKYGMHENALSKARLLLLIDELCHNHEQATYFPSYEIITDELRDYRFYAPDMLHPTEQAADYVWERFTEWCFGNEMKEYAHERQALTRDLNHRPIHPESAEFRRFQDRVKERQLLFEQKWNEKWS